MDIYIKENNNEKEFWSCWREFFVVKSIRFKRLSKILSKSIIISVNEENDVKKKEKWWYIYININGTLLLCVEKKCRIIIKTWIWSLKKFNVFIKKIKWFIFIKSSPIYK